VLLSSKLQLENLAIIHHHISYSLSWEIQLALLPFRSLLIRESLLFSFPTGTKMFQFPAWFCLSAWNTSFSFGNLGIKSRMHFPQAYRSLPRPSSKFKPSYPSNSFFRIYSKSSLIKQIIIYSSRANAREMSISDFLYCSHRISEPPAGSRCIPATKC